MGFCQWVVRDKAEWDLIQRLLLLLTSDGSVVIETGPARCTTRQAVVALGLILARWTSSMRRTATPLS